MPRGLQAHHQALRPPMRAPAPAIALVLSLVLHGLAFWGLGAMRPAVQPATSEITLSLRLETWPQVSRQSTPTEVLQPAEPAEAVGTPALSEASDAPAQAPAEERARPNRRVSSRPGTVAQRTSTPPTIQAARVEPRRVPASPAPLPSEAVATADALHWDMLQRIEQFKSYPRAARRARMEGTARVWMQIDRNGVLRGQRLEASSGHRILDEAALTLVRRAAPYPRLPGAAPERIEVVLPVSYRLETGS